LGGVGAGTPCVRRRRFGSCARDLFRPAGGSLLAAGAEAGSGGRRLMEFQDEAFVLAARTHGETGAIVDLLTAGHGKFVAHVAGGASRRMKPFLQAGARVLVSYRARM